MQTTSKNDSRIPELNKHKLAGQTLPDLDIDVDSVRRHDIYREVFQVFGAERVSLMSMTNAYRGRGAVRDAGLALGMTEDQVDLLTSCAGV